MATGSTAGSGRAWRVGLLALAYFVSGWLGLLVAAPPGNVTALWPPSGIALVALLLGGRPLWPGIFIGAFVTNVVMFPSAVVDGRSIAGAALIAAGSTLEIIVAHALITRFAGGRAALATARRVPVLLCCTAVASAIAASTGFVATTVVGGAHVEPIRFWGTWWLGDFAGMLVLGPAAFFSPRASRPLEWVATILFSLAVGEVLFARPFGLTSGTTLPVAWLFLPAIVWTAMRLPASALTVHTLLIHVLASWGTVDGIGPFAPAGLPVVNAMLIVVVVLGLTVLATVNELQAAATVLEERVADRTAALELAHAEVTRELAEKARLQHVVVEAQKQEALGRLAGGVAHDFNNLLTVIGAEAGEMTRSTDQVVQDGARTILAATDRAAELTRQLLAVAQKPMGRTEVVAVDEALASLRRLVRPVLPSDISLDVVSDGAGFVRVIPGQLDQVLLNLALNAREALRPGGTLRIVGSQQPTLDDDARARGLTGGPWVIIEVIDDGAGIDTDVLPRIFEPFFTTRAGRGTGLGLSTAAAIISQAGGALTVRSTPGKGSTFRVWLPAVAAEPVAAPPLAVAPTVAGRWTVLVAEDEAMVRRILVQQLERDGHRVLAAADGEEALAIFRAQPEAIDIIVTDVVMPRLGGVELLRAVRAVRDVPALVVSGYHEHQSDLADEHLLAKPFTPGQLREALAAVKSRRAAAAGA